jgi:quercetin dioxygenase-like cupin family protein
LIPHWPDAGFGLYEDLLFAACRHPTVRKRPRGCAEVEERQGDPVCQQELPNVPRTSIQGVLVEYGPGGCAPGHTHPKFAFPYATVLEGTIRSQVNDGP